MACRLARGRPPARRGQARAAPRVLRLDGRDRLRDNRPAGRRACHDLYRGALEPHRRDRRAPDGAPARRSLGPPARNHRAAETGRPGGGSLATRGRAAVRSQRGPGPRPARGFPHFERSGVPLESGLARDALAELSRLEIWQAGSAWYEHLEGPPRIAENVYSWSRVEAEGDAFYLPTPGPGDSDGGDIY